MRTRLGLVVAIALFIAVPLFAEDNPKQALSFSFGNGDNSIAYRHLFGSYAGLVAFGYERATIHQSNSEGVNQNQTSRTWNVSAGLRRYFGARQQVTPFLETDVSRSFPNTYAPGCPGYHATGAAFGGGAEYHVTRSVSVEGMAGITYYRTHNQCTDGSLTYRDDYHQFNTFRSAVALNFYF